MRRIMISFCAALLLLMMAACGNDGPVPSQGGPTVPPPGGNPGGVALQLQCSINLSATTGHAPMPVTMWANVTGGMGPFIYRWDVNGDGLWDFIGLGVSVIGINYASPGIYDIHLEVEDAQGQAYRASALVDVKESGPHAIPTANPSTGNSPLTVTLNGSGSYDGDGYVVLYEWDFESDGVWDFESPATGVTTADYPNQGTYSATLRVTDDDGLTDEASVQIIAL